MKKTFIPIPPMAEMPESETIDTEKLVSSWSSGEIDMICVLGPTASGKTRYAVNLAERICGITGGKPGAEIISADSRQVYRGMDIGTGKDLEEYGSVPYHLIDIADAGTRYNIFQYQRDFERAYSDITGRGNIPILCGGSGLYIEAVTKGYRLPDVPENRELREKLEKEDMESLTRRLASLKTLHNKTDLDTKKRIIRAIEIATYAREHQVGHTPYLPKNTYFIGTLVSRDERNARIDRRLDARLEQGMTDEIRALLDSGISPEDLIYYGLEYKFVTLYLIGEISYGQMRESLATAIHQFAKRQMTWFRGMERKGTKIHWTSDK